MHIKRSEIIEIINKHMDVDLELHLERMIDLTWLATLVSAIAFQCKPEECEAKKKEFLEFLTCSNKTSSSILKAAKAYAFSITYENDEHAVDYMDLSVIRMLVSFLFHALLSKQAIDAWIDQAWEHGVRQHQIHTCQVEGGVQNIIGIVTSFASHVSLFGEREGLLPTAEATVIAP